MADTRYANFANGKNVYKVEVWIGEGDKKVLGAEETITITGDIQDTVLSVPSGKYYLR